MTTTRRVQSTDGVSLAVYEAGDPAAPTVVAVHGYPDNHGVWTGLAGLLSDNFHVVTYDVRGTGDSDKPSGVEPYRMPSLVADLQAVIEATSPDDPVHLLGHDWGSVQSWAAVTGNALGGRIASYTSISGPSLDYTGIWFRGIREAPRNRLRQAAHSSYVFVIRIPRLPEWLIGRGMLDGGVQGDGVDRSREDKLNGLWLYRANVLGRMRRPEPEATHIPVQVIVPERDPYVLAPVALESPRPYVANLRTDVVDGSHWVVSRHPELIAPLVTDFVRSVRTTS